MDESIITLVVVPNKEKAVELEVRANENDVLEFYLDHKLVFSGDWSGNFAHLFKRALEIWESEE